MELDVVVGQVQLQPDRADAAIEQRACACLLSAEDSQDFLNRQRAGRQIDGWLLHVFFELARAVILSPGKILRLDLSMTDPGVEALEDREPTIPAASLLTEIEMREFQKSNLVAALRQAGWKVSGPGGAAELLGVKPTTLTDRIRAFGVSKSD